MKIERIVWVWFCSGKNWFCPIWFNL